MTKSVKFYLTIIILAIPIIIYLVIFSRKNRILYDRMEQEGITDTAVIVREFTGAKGKLYFEYIFNTNGRSYNGFIQYSPSHGPVHIGDSFLVKYLPDDPDEVNKLIENHICPK